MDNCSKIVKSGERGGMMKKFGYVLLCAGFLCGCILPGKIDRDTVLGETSLITESALPFEDEIQESSKVEKELKDEEEAEYVSAKTESFTDEVKAALMRKQQNLYYFSNLEITQQNLYVEILYALENYIDEMEVSIKDTNQIDQVFQCVLLDHPEIFYTDGYSFVKYTLGDEIKKITFKGTYILVIFCFQIIFCLIDNGLIDILYFFIVGCIRTDPGKKFQCRFFYLFFFYLFFFLIINISSLKSDFFNLIP